MSYYSHVTLLFSQPRSRTQWLAWLYGHAIEAWHDPLACCVSIEELVAKIDARGTEPLFIADTAALHFHNRLLGALPGARALYVERPIAEVVASLERVGGRASLRDLERARAVLMAQGLRNAPPGCYAPYDLLDLYAQTWWPKVTGKTFPWGEKGYCRVCETRIDVPLPEQLAKGDPVKFRQLWAAR